MQQKEFKSELVVRKYEIKFHFRSNNDSFVDSIKFEYPSNKN